MRCVMRIKLLYDGPYGGHFEEVVVTREDMSDTVIRRRLFPGCMGIPFDDENCSYEILKLEKEAISK